MISNQLFKYYTSQDFKVKSDYFAEINSNGEQDKIESIETLAEDTVRNGAKVLTRDKFKSDAEHQIYLLAVSQCAWAQHLGAEIESPIIT